MTNEEEGRPPKEPQEPAAQPEHTAQQEPEENSEGQVQVTFNKPDFDQMTATALKVITNPVGFYQEMPKSGGLVDPLIFMVALAVLAGLLSAVLSIFGLGMSGAMAAGLAAVILIPVFAVIFGFIGAAIAFVIWKLMGSRENFETAFRCVAYTSAVAPIITVLSIIPYIGSLASGLWPMALLAVASIHVHGRAVQVSWGVFGTLGVIMALINVGAERATNQMSDSLEDFQRMMEQRDQ